jgi:carbon-monoxide dehydrogenase medium subunit
MIPAPFDYHRPKTLDEAIRLLATLGDEAKILAGGHSLVPAMKLRLAQPGALIDIGGMADLRYIRTAGDRIAIGAMTTHRDVEASAVIREGCPLLAEMAPQIGDLQVRNRGTIGGSLVHADPAADWPAGILALDAELEVAGPSGRRVIRAGAFFVDLLQTALAPNEILCEIRVPRTPGSVAYEKTRQKASGFALAGAAVVVLGGAAHVGITGVAPRPYRASAVEQALGSGPLADEAIRAAASRAAVGVDPLGDIHASPEYRAHLAQVNTRRALERAARRA